MTDTGADAPVWLVTGGTSGFGLSIAKAAASAGARVVAAGLMGPDEASAADGIEGEVHLESLNVLDEDNVRAVVAGCIAKFGRIDVLVNNAGYAVFGAFEETSVADGERMFDVNFFGALAMTRETLPQMRAQKSGTIVNISSVGGFDGSACFSYYSASKFALEGFSESLVREVGGFGIRVMIVEPASMRTNFRGSSMTMSECAIADYQEMSDRISETIKAGHGLQSGDPDKAAVALYKAATSDKPPLRLPLGNDAFRRVRSKLVSVEDDLKEWEDVSRDIEFAS